VWGGRGQLLWRGGRPGSRRGAGSRQGGGLRCCCRVWREGLHLGEFQQEARRWCGGLGGVPCFCGPDEKHRRHVRDEATAGLKGRRVNSMAAAVALRSRAGVVFSTSPGPGEIPLGCNQCTCAEIITAKSSPPSSAATISTRRPSGFLPVHSLRRHRYIHGPRLRLIRRSPVHQLHLHATSDLSTRPEHFPKLCPRCPRT
jgi:hypothetical protein